MVLFINSEFNGLGFWYLKKNNYDFNFLDVCELWCNKCTFFIEKCIKCKHHNSVTNLHILAYSFKCYSKGKNCIFISGISIFYTFYISV